MGKYGSYEDRDDRGRLFDGGEIEDDVDEGSRLPLLLVIGLLVVAVFAGVVWVAYKQGVQRGRLDAPRVLAAASGPVKVAPANPGGSDTPFKGLKIYQQPAPSDDVDTESAPPAPTPRTAAHAPSVTAAPTKAVISKAESSAVEETRVTQTASAETSAPPSVVATKPPRALQPPKPAALPHVKPAESGPDIVAAAPERTVAPVKTTAPAAHVAAGGVALQIGAYKSEEEAGTAWMAFSRKHAMVSAYSDQIKKVDLGDKGVWYRLRLAGFSDKSAAQAFCEKLKADGGTCFLAR